MDRRLLRLQGRRLQNRRHGSAGSDMRAVLRISHGGMESALKHRAHERTLCQRRGLLEIPCLEPNAIRAPPLFAAANLPIHFSPLFSTPPSFGHAWGCEPAKSRMVVPKPSPVQLCLALHATRPMPATPVVARQADFRRKEGRMTALAFTIDPFPAAWGLRRGLRPQYMR